MPWCLGDVGVGAREQHAEVGPVAARRPHLLPVDDPLVAVELGTGVEPGEVGAGAGLAEELAPGLLAGDDVEEVALLLLLGAVDVDRRAREQRAEAARRTERGERRRSSASRARPRTATAPLPNHSSGHVGTAQPERPRRSHHSSTVRSGSQLASSQAVTSAVRSSVGAVVDGGHGASPYRVRRAAWRRRAARRWRCAAA